MMDWPTTASIVGASVAVLGVVITALKGAEERGRMKQRQDEVEADVEGAFAKIREVKEQDTARAAQLEARQNEQEADAAALRATLRSVEGKVDYTNTKLDELIRFHTKASAMDHS